MPDQATTGAIMSADVGTTLPTDASGTITGFDDSGYVSSDGLTLSPSISTEDITEWSGKLIRRVLSTFDGTIKFSLMQLDAVGWKQAFGDDHVTVTAANATHGNQIAISMGSSLPEKKSWVFKMKDGKNKMLVVVPNGQVTALDDITFAASSAINLPITISCYDDGTGNSIYVYTDDDEVTAA